MLFLEIILLLLTVCLAGSPSLSQESITLLDKALFASTTKVQEEYLNLFCSNHLGPLSEIIDPLVIKAMEYAINSGSPEAANVVEWLRYNSNPIAMSNGNIVHTADIERLINTRITFLNELISYYKHDEIKCTFWYDEIKRLKSHLKTNKSNCDCDWLFCCFRRNIN